MTKCPVFGITPLARSLAGLCLYTISAVAIADCREDLEALDSSFSSAGYMLNDNSVTTTSGYLEQGRSLRDSALVMLSHERDDECVKLVAQAQRLVARASMPSVFSAEELVGREVVDPSGQSVGEIENIMVDLDRGIAAYALIAFGGFLGMGEDLVPVPFGKLSQSAGSDALEISTSFQRVENAPRYIEGDWDLLSRRSWATDVYNYYGEDPYWTDRRERASRRNTSSGGDMQMAANTTENAEQTGASAETAETSNVEAHEPLRGFKHLFKVLDMDGNGTLDKDEARREFAVLKNFSTIDENGDESLTEEEVLVLSKTNRISDDGETIIPNAKDALPEEKWTGGKEETEGSDQ